MRFITDIKEQLRILDLCHKDPTSGHLGTKKTLARILQRFIWPGVSKDVYLLVSVCDYFCFPFSFGIYYYYYLQIKTCDICQRTGRKVALDAPELNPVTVVSPWYQIGIDFIGPIYPASTQGNRYILTVCDYFTKFVHATATETKLASRVADALFKVNM